MSSPQDPQDPQERFAGEPGPGARDTGSDVPSGGEDRPSGAISGDESVPSHGSGEDPGFNTRKKKRNPTPAMTGLARRTRSHAPGRGQALIGHHWSRGTSKSAQSARQTSRGSTPSSMACAAVRPSKTGQHMVDEQ